jgi:putative spermidine/putrescine transport system permease protein
MGPRRYHGVRHTMKRVLIIGGLALPALALMLVAFILPMLWLGRLSLDRSTGGGVLVEDVSVSNYLQFFQDPFYLGIMWRSLWMSVAVTLLSLVCSYPIALFLFRTRSRWRGVLAILTISPLLVSSVVRTFGWMVILGDTGLINGLLRYLGVIDTPLPLMNNMLGVLIGLTEIEMPTMTLALMAGFSRLDATVEEAARTLGASPWRTLLRVTLPLSAPGIVIGCLITFVLVMSSFITPALLGGGRIYVMATAIYQEALETLNWPLAATVSIILIAVFGACVASYERISRRWAQ